MLHAGDDFLIMELVGYARSERHYVTALAFIAQLYKAYPLFTCIGM